MCKNSLTVRPIFVCLCMTVFYLGLPCGHLLGKSCPLGFSLVLVLLSVLS